MPTSVVTKSADMGTVCITGPPESPKKLSNMFKKVLRINKNLPLQLSVPFPLFKHICPSPSEPNVLQLILSAKGNLTFLFTGLVAPKIRLLRLKCININ